jgi:hypothetical protein
MIHLSESGHGPGTIIVAANIQPRYYEFHLSLDALGAPAGTKLHIERSCDITQNFNNGVKAMIGEWAWFLGDDHSFSPTVLMRLLSHQVDVVVPITPTKTPPWGPCVLHGPTDGRIWHTEMPLYRWSELSGPGLLALPQGDFIGQAGMLVRRSVLEKIGYPTFKAGRLDPGRLQEDLSFCRELQQMGVTIYIDQEIIFDHHAPVCVTARKHEGVWVPSLKAGTGSVMVMAGGVRVMDDCNSQVPRTSNVKWALVDETLAREAAEEEAPA